MLQVRNIHLIQKILNFVQLFNTLLNYYFKKMNESDDQNGVHMRTPRSITEVPYIPQTPPAGLASLYMLCKRIYPDQCNPLQATTVIKFW